MLALKESKNSAWQLLRITKKTPTIWKVQLGYWLNGEEAKHRLNTTSETLLSSIDLINFSKEIKKHLKQKPTEESLRFGSRAT